MNLLVTGGAGFIGSAFTRHVLTHRSHFHVVNLDKLTYAGNLENLEVVRDSPRYAFVHGDICDRQLVARTLAESRVDAVVHFAAESHVDRSILSPEAAVRTNVLGTATLLAEAHAARVGRFLHVSTDEVYGDLATPAEADESFPLKPSSPYAASKAASDLLVLSYARTYGLPALVTRASNNYGPYQFPEKLIPLMISRALDNLSLPVYGDGLQVRDWLYVDDHCRALVGVLERGKEGEVYNIGGNCSLTNMDVVTAILDLVGASHALIEKVADRPGHDRRYALRSDKLFRDTGFAPSVTFDDGLRRTIDWYRSHAEWTRRVQSGEYRHFYEKNYGSRGGAHRGDAAAAPA